MDIRNKLRSVAESYKSRSFRFGGYSLVISAVAVAIAVVVNLIVSALPGRLVHIDTTAEGLYTVSPQTEQIASAIDKDVTLVWVVSAGNEDIYLEGLLENYSQLSSHIDVVKLDPVVSPAALRRYASGDISPDDIEDNSVIVTSGSASKLLNYRYDIYTYSDYSLYYQYYYYYGTEMLDSFCAERSISSAIGYVTSEDLPVIYLLTGHGEQDISGLYSEIEHENIRLESLDLDLAGTVPGDCACLMLASPAADISKAEREAIETYVSAGGHILLLTTCVSNADMPNLLEMMQENFGVSLVDGVVFEEDSAYHYVGFPEYLYPEILSHEITEPLISGGYRILLPDAQGLVIADDMPAGVEAVSLASTSAAAYSQTEFNEEYERRESDVNGPFSLAVAASTDGGGELVWISSVYILDTMSNEMSGGANMDLFLNSISWMCDHEESVGIRQIALNYNYLTFDNASAVIYGIVLILCVPAVFIVEGIITVIRRRKRQ